MARLGDVSRKGALDGLLALYRQHPQPVGQMDFAREARLDPGLAARVRDDLSEAGLIDAKTVRSASGPLTYRLTLTPLGLRAARVVEELGRILEGSDLDERARAAMRVEDEEIQEASKAKGYEGKPKVQSDAVDGAESKYRR